jgi:hypothetical protein
MQLLLDIIVVSSNLMQILHFLFLILLCASSGLCFRQSGAQVLQSTLQKMGGTERWQALRSLELRYNEETQHSFNMLGQEIASEKIRKELKFYRYPDIYGFVDNNYVSDIFSNNISSRNITH